MLFGQRKHSYRVLAERKFASLVKYYILNQDDKPQKSEFPLKGGYEQGVSAYKVAKMLIEGKTEVKYHKLAPYVQEIKELLKGGKPENKEQQLLLL